MSSSFSTLLRNRLATAGFNLVGFAPLSELKEETARLREWLAASAHAGMQYMERKTDIRENPRLIEEEFVSVVSVGLNYNTGHTHSGRPGTGKISRYAWGKDYHLIMWEKIDSLIAELKAEDPTLKTFRCVDTGPVMDKVWAQKAGIGWMGKHTNIINRANGSWFFIGTIFINKVLDYDAPVEDLCGICTACIDACPTKAIEKPYFVNAGKCLSYQTIENKGDIDKGLKGSFDNWLFGCDVCQDVCPWNIRFGAITEEESFAPVIGTDLQLDYFDNMETGEFKEKFSESPLLRAKLKGLQRNAGFLKNESNFSAG